MMESSNVKLEWMYKPAESSVDKEEYLLGRAIDKTFERNEFGADYELDKDGVPRSIFASVESTSQIDLQRKKQEDPLEAIRQKEIEMRKQLLKNPIKLRKLQNMLKEQKKSSTKKKKKHKKKRHDSSSSSEDEAKDLDTILALKYAKLVKKFGKEKLTSIKSSSGSDSSDSEEDTSKKYKSEKGKHKSDCEDSNKRGKKKKTRRSASVDSDERQRKNRTAKSDSEDSDREGKFKHREPSKSSSKAPKEEHRRKRRSITPDDDFSKRKSRRSHSPEPKHSRRRYDDRKHKNESDDSDKERKNYGLSVSKYAPRSRSHHDKKQDPKKPETKPWKKPERSKLSSEEIEKRRKEMMQNAKWREDLRVENVKRSRREEQEEKKREKEYDSDFMLKQMSGVVTVHGSVEDRIKSKINSIQRTKAALDKSFVQR